MEPKFINFKDHEDYEAFLNLNAITGLVIKQMPDNPIKYIIAWDTLGGTSDKTIVYKNTMERIRGIMIEHSLT
jgi:hypothetical protein